MVGSALLGAIALGGALAFAYKQSGGGIGSGEQPPLVTADDRPVKELPDQPGGKDFPHKNKLIYDRLQNGDEPEADHLVPRQEDVAVPALPPRRPRQVAFRRRSRRPISPRRRRPRRWIARARPLARRPRLSPLPTIRLTAVRAA